MHPDAELLHRYAETGDERAFAAWVAQHVDTVYAVARRTVGGDAHLAQDVAQRVFADAAREAARLSRHPAPRGWLFKSAHFAATQVVRAEQRRRAREQEAQAMNELNRESESVAWERLRPGLDDLIAELGEGEREAVLLRFYEDKAWAEVGARLRLSEDGARSRVERALEKMRVTLVRRGVTASTAALGLALSGQAGAAPAGLAAAVAHAALVGQAAAGAGGGWAIFMSMSKLQMGVVGAVAAAGAAGFAVQAETAAGLRREIAALRPETAAVAAVREENRQLAATAAEVAGLRRDDAELRRLEQEVGEVRRETEKRAQARLAAQRADQTARRTALAEGIREKDRRAQAEVERLNREGNALVIVYKTLAERLKDAALTAEERAAAHAEATAKLEEIKAKQREIKEFLANAQAALAPEVQELRQLSALLGVEPNVWPPGGTPASAASGPVPAGGRLHLRPAGDSGTGGTFAVPPSGWTFRPGGQP